MECKDLQTQGMWSKGLGTPVMSKEEVMSVIRSFGMGKFAGAVMWVLKEVFVGGNEKCPRWDTDGCPQADYGMECESSEFKQILNGGPQADCVGERELPGIIRELKKNKFAPWMICEPNEKEGKKLLEEIMKGGNFGQYGSLTMGFIDHISKRRGRPYGLIYALSKQNSSIFCIIIHK